MKRLFIFLALLLSFINVFAYENKYFSLNIPDKYIQTIDKKYSYKWTLNNDYISVDITKNKNYNIKKFSSKDILKHKEYFLKKYSDYKVEDFKIDKYNKDDLYYLEFNMIIDSKTSVGYKIYQKGRIYTTDNYIYVVIVNSDKAIENNDILDSFNVKDSYLHNINILEYFILLVILGFIIIFLNHLINKKHK